MTIPEASQLVIQAGALGQGGEVFVLDMGEPVKIMELAEDLIALSGFTPYEDIDIDVIGLRPGEKLYEKLLSDTEDNIATEHELIFINNLEAVNQELLDKHLAKLENQDEIKYELVSCCCVSPEQQVFFIKNYIKLRIFSLKCRKNYIDLEIETKSKTG